MAEKTDANKNDETEIAGERVWKEAGFFGDISGLIMTWKRGIFVKIHLSILIRPISPFTKLRKSVIVISYFGTDH